MCMHAHTRAHIAPTKTSTHVQKLISTAHRQWCKQMQQLWTEHKDNIQVVKQVEHRQI